MPISPTFSVYAITCLVLCLNVLVVWAYSGAARAKTKTAINNEDATRLKVKHEEVDPPEVARVLRAYTNAAAAIYPFLFLGLVFVLLGGSVGFARIDFGVFAVVRVLHSVVYLAGKQPWRTIFFVLGVVATLALMGDIVWLLVESCGH